jgi:hypothetical protein
VAIFFESQTFVLAVTANQQLSTNNCLAAGCFESWTFVLAVTAN